VGAAPPVAGDGAVGVAGAGVAGVGVGVVVVGTGLGSSFFSAWTKKN